MKKFRTALLAGLVFLCFSFATPTKTIKEYNIHIAGVKVGEMIATREIDNEFTTYTLNSLVSIYIFHTYKVKDDVKAVYKDNILQYATVKTSVGKTNYFSAIIWSKDHYDVDINAYKYQKHGTETKQIEYSVAKAYFEEPPASAHVYSEDYGMFSDVNFIQAHINQLLFLGKKDKFSYSNGIVVKADMQSTIKDFIISEKP